MPHVTALVVCAVAVGVTCIVYHLVTALLSGTRWFHAFFHTERIIATLIIDPIIVSVACLGFVAARFLTSICIIVQVVCFLPKCTAEIISSVFISVSDPGLRTTTVGNIWRNIRVNTTLPHTTALIPITVVIPVDEPIRQTTFIGIVRGEGGRVPTDLRTRATRFCITVPSPVTRLANTATLIVYCIFTRICIDTNFPSGTAFIYNIVFIPVALPSRHTTLTNILDAVLTCRTTFVFYEIAISVAFLTNVTTFVPLVGWNCGIDTGFCSILTALIRRYRQSAIIACVACSLAGGA